MKPPPVARAVVRLFAAPADRALLLEDLADRFQEVAAAEGVRGAKRWYWSQALSVLPSALVPDFDLIRRRSCAGLVGDLRSGLRTFVRRPIYAVGVVGTLGLGLAAATITFAVAWNVWLAPMPYPDPDRVVRLYEIEPADETTTMSREPAQGQRWPLSPPLLEDLRSNSWRTLEAVSAVSQGVREWAQGAETKRVSAFVVSPDFFGILGIAPTLGRLPTVGGTAEILVSERFWRTDLGGDPDVVGSARMILNEEAHRVVGVAPLPHAYPREADVVAVIDWDEGDLLEEMRSTRYLDALARIRPGHSVADARTEVSAFVAALGETHPRHQGWGGDAVVLADDIMRPFRDAIALLLAAGTTFLLIAGVNVTGLVAARRVAGRQDRSIRLALGASEGRLLRGSLIESLVLAAVGSIAGVVSADWLIAPIRAFVPQDVPRLADVAVTPSLMIGGLAVGIVLGALIGVSGYAVSLGAKPSVGRARLWGAVRVGGRRAFVVTQVALTTLLTAGGVAILHHVSELRAIDLGFEPAGVWTTPTALNRDRYPSAESRWNAWRAILDGLHARGVPAAVAANVPMGAEEDLRFSLPMDAQSEVSFQFHPVSTDYFSVMGIEMLAGRAFGPMDHASSAPVVIVSQDFADEYFPDEGIVGRVVQGVTVIGVAESTRHQGPDAPVTPELYAPLAQRTFYVSLGSLLVRGQTEGVATKIVSEVVAEVDPDLRLPSLIPYTSHLSEWYAPLRLQLVMIGVLATLGLVLASLGMYSLMAYQVATQRQELGIRKAVGAPDGRLMLGVVAGGVTMALVGALIGLAAWYQLRPWTRGLVDGIDSAGYLVPLAVTLVVGGSCVVATLVPAVRATQVDPVATLKAE